MNRLYIASQPLALCACPWPASSTCPPARSSFRHAADNCTHIQQLQEAGQSGIRDDFGDGPKWMLHMRDAQARALERHTLGDAQGRPVQSTSR